MVATTPRIRLTGVLAALDVAVSSWYRKAVPEDQRRRPGPAPKPIPEPIVQAVVKMSQDNPWYGYKRIAVMCRREGMVVTDRQAYQVMRQHELLHKRRSRVAELYQASKLYELLPQERFHRTLKEEEVYWRLYDHPAHCRECLDEFRQRYNRRRPHWALIPTEGGDPLVPEEVYTGGRTIAIPRWQGWAKGAKEKLDRMLAGQAA